MASKKPSWAGEALGLFTDFIQGVRAGIKVAGGTDARLNRLREQDVITAVVNLIMAPAQSGLEFLDRTVTVMMDLSKTMDQLIADGRYGWINSNITKHFSIATESGTRPTEIHLLHYNKAMTSDQVIADMDRQGLRPATFLELLWIGIQHPSLQLELPIIALGAVVKLHGNRSVAFLDRYGRGRGLLLGWFDGDWSGRCRFAAVRK